MGRITRSAALLSAAAIVASIVGAGATAEADRAPTRGPTIERAALHKGSIKHIIVIDMENKNYDETFGATSPATYLNKTLLPKGELIPNYFATSHVSLGNYIAQVSGQAPTPSVNNDCLDLTTFMGGYTNVTPGNDDPNRKAYPGQVDGDGCVFPKPTATSHGARTIANQLDALFPHPSTPRASWRGYAEDMGDNPTRDGGAPDPLGGTDCAHPTIGGPDVTNKATPTDQYATRHNPFMYFHSIIDDVAKCNANVVPLGKVTVGSPDTFTGHLAQDLAREETTPKFSFISPNLCNDGHDDTCAGVNTEGGRTGGLVGLDLWLEHWMPLILGSPAYKSGTTLVVVTFDEAEPAGTGADSRACCGERGGPNLSNPGFSPLLGLIGVQTTPAPGTFPYPGGGQVGAVLLNPRYIVPGTINTTGSYNHYSALRSYEDLLGIIRGGDDGFGHLGFAAVPHLRPFGRDVFNAP